MERVAATTRPPVRPVRDGRIVAIWPNRPTLPDRGPGYLPVQMTFPVLRYTMGNAAPTSSGMSHGRATGQ